MFLTTDVFFFILWSSKYNGPVWIRSQYLDLHFVYIWNVIHSQKTTLPVIITSFWNTVYFCLFPTGEELFPGCGSLTFYSYFDLDRPVINQLWFPEHHFSLCLGKVHVQMKIYERLLQALLSLAPCGFVARSLAHSCVAHPNRRACPKATSSSSLS